jgi:uncharacterized protein
MRWVFIILGTFFVGLAVVGIFLPLLPSTPFLLLAAACYARGSDRLYQWIMNHRTFGPIIRSWRANRSIPAGAKKTALAMIAAAFTLSTFSLRAQPWIAAPLAVFGVGLFVWVSRLPESGGMEET